MSDGRPDKAEPVAWAADDAAQTLPLLDYLQLLWFRRRLIIVITLFVAVVAWIQVNEIQDIYSARSTMLIGQPESRVVDIETVLAGTGTGDDVATEIEVLRSRVLAARIIERLKASDHPKNFDYTPVRTSTSDFKDDVFTIVRIFWN